jgi:hypothetical protein
VKPFITPRTLQIYRSQTIFYSPSWKWLHFVDVAEIQEAMTDELKKVQKEVFLASFKKWYNSKKAC